MEALLHEIAHYVALVVEAIAILIIAIGSIEALVNIFRTFSRRAGTGMSVQRTRLSADLASFSFRRT